MLSLPLRTLLPPPSSDYLTTTSSPLKNKQTNNTHKPTKTLKDRNTKHCVYSKHVSVPSSASHDSTLLRAAVHLCPGVTCVLGSGMTLLPTWLSGFLLCPRFLLSLLESPLSPDSHFLLFSLSWWAHWFHGFKRQIYIGIPTLPPCVWSTLWISWISGI